MPKSNHSPSETNCVTTATIAVKHLKDRAPTAFELVPDPAAIAGLVQTLELLDLRKTRLKGTLTPANAADWDLAATLGATAVQACVVSGDPVTTRLDVPVIRRFVKGFHLPETAGETEFDGEDDIEPLPEVIDLLDILRESLSLNLPEYPRAEGAELGEAVFTAPGLAPLRDEDVKPFAALAALKDKSTQ